MLFRSDPDAGSSFTYALVNGDGGDDNAAFDISGNKLIAKNSFDFESKSSYKIRVRSTDNGGLSVEKLFTITVTDVNETPTNIGLSTTSIAENAGASAVVGVLTTSDPDAGSSFTYALVTGDGGDDNAAFDISGDKLIAKSSFDFESKSSYKIRVRSTDNGGLSVEKLFTISVTDVPSDISLSDTSIVENSGSDALEIGRAHV